MTRLSDIEEDIDLVGLEPLVCDAADQVDALTSLIFSTFEGKPTSGPGGDFYMLTESEGRRLFFMASVAHDMAAKVREAYYAAHENGQAAKSKSKRGTA